VNDAVGGEKRLTGLDDHRRLTVKVVLPCSLNDVDDLLARMKVPGRRRAAAARAPSSAIQWLIQQFL
jgi:hypothetical protein